MKFEFCKCVSNKGVEISGLYHIIPAVFKDSRGEFFECYNQNDFFDAGLNMRFVQDNQSMSVKGVLRGLHFQTKHPQGKLVRCLAGCVYDVAVDLRKDSETFCHYCGLILDSEKRNQFYIPAGFAHGFYVLSDMAVCSYKCSDFYDSDGEGGIMWNDSSIGINWPLDKNKMPILSDKDRKYDKFDIKKDYFDNSGKWIG